MQITITRIQEKQRREYKRIRAGLALFLRNLHIQNYSQHDVDLMYLGFAFGTGYAAYKRSLKAVQDGEFREEEHSRDKDGKFAKNASGQSAQPGRKNARIPELNRKISISSPEQIHCMTAVIVTDEQCEAILKYTGAGEEFDEIQSNLRSKQGPSDKVRKDAELINQAINEATLTQQIKVYRGISSHAFAERLEVGRTFSDPGFTSTSTSISVAYKFSKNVVLEVVHVPSGSHALSIQNSRTAQGRSVQAFEQNEILLPSGSTFIVREIKRHRYGSCPLIVIVELISPDRETL